MHKIGILGGSFDPIHIGHLSIAQQVSRALALETVWLIPAGAPPHKELAAPPADRLAMCRLAVQGLRGLHVSEIEAHKTTPSYTIETIQKLREQLGEAVQTYFIIGADTVPELPTWHRIDELAGMTRWAIVKRIWFPPPDFSALRGKLSDATVDILAQSVVKIDELVDVSSTEIRQRLAAGDHVRGLLRRPVLEHIQRRRLYGAR